MKRPALATDIVPVADFRANIATYLEQVSGTGRPVVLTQRGRSAGALVSPAMLDTLEEERDLVTKVLRGLRESAAGEVIDDDEVWATMDTHLRAATKSKRTVKRRATR